MGGGGYPAGELDRSPKQSNQCRIVNIAGCGQADVAGALAGAGEQPGGVGQVDATREAQVEAGFERHDDAEGTFISASKAIGEKAGGQVDLLDGSGRLSEHQPAGL